MSEQSGDNVEQVPCDPGCPVCEHRGEHVEHGWPVDEPRLGQQTANAIAARLVELGWTQADLAREMGLTAKHVNQIMTGKATGSPRLLDLIAWGLGCRWSVVLVPAPLPDSGSPAD